MLGVLAHTPAALAAPDAPAPAPAPAQATAGRCTTGVQSALQEIACALAIGAPDLRQALVVSAAVSASEPLERGAELAARLTRSVAGSLGARVGTSPSDLSRARQLAKAHGTLVYLSPTLRDGKLSVTLDVYAAPSSFWDRVRQPSLASLHHAYAERRVDAEIRSFSPRVPLVAGRPKVFDLGEPEVLALACGDTGADGSLELVVVGRHRVMAGRLRQGRFVPGKLRQWQELAQVAPAPLRQPLGSAAIRSDGSLDVGSTDRDTALRLDGDLQVQRELGRRLPWPGGGCAEMAAVSLESNPAPCVADGPSPRAGGVSGVHADAIAGARIVGQDGSVRSVRAVRDSERATVVLFDDAGRRVELGGAGAQIALGDLDLDGQPEVVVSHDTLAPSEDALRVFTWTAAGKLEERFRLPVPRGIRALAVCPPEDGGAGSIALATGQSLWWIR